MNAHKHKTVYLALLGLLSLALVACQSGYQSSKNVKSIPTKTVASKKVVKPASDNKSLGTNYIVQAGDTLYSISFRAGLNYRDVAAWNNIDESYHIQSGQKLRLTAPTQVPSSTVVKSSLAPLPNVKPTLVKPAPVVGSTVKPVVAATTSIVWQWPAKGEIISAYIADDKTNQGINIAGKSGQKILAASDGVVVYSGAGLIGYGELLIVKHNNEWISAYAHNSKRLVAEGVKVKAGQHIADMGRTGAVRDMLHFEIRRNGKPVDPLLYLPKL
jgi:lipoprotein NlpD